MWKNHAIPPFVQHMWVDRVRSEKGVHIQVEELESDHVPFLSVPEKLLEMINKVIS